jgi:hypothetical protein
MLTVNVSLAVHHFVTNLLRPKCCAEENGNILNLWAVFNALSHTPELLACFVLAEASIYKILWNSRVFPDFLYMVKTTSNSMQVSKCASLRQCTATTTPYSEAALNGHLMVSPSSVITTNLFLSWNRVLCQKGTLFSAIFHHNKAELFVSKRKLGPGNLCVNSKW